MHTIILHEFIKGCTHKINQWNNHVYKISTIPKHTESVHNMQQALNVHITWHQGYKNITLYHILQRHASYIKGVLKYYYGVLFYKYKIAKRNFLSTYI